MDAVADRGRDLHRNCRVDGERGHVARGWCRIRFRQPAPPRQSPAPAPPRGITDLRIALNGRFRKYHRVLANAALQRGTTPQ